MKDMKSLVMNKTKTSENLKKDFKKFTSKNLKDYAKDIKRESKEFNNKLYAGVTASYKGLYSQVRRSKEDD